MPNKPDPAFMNKLRTALLLYPASERYLIGVSGGRDSVALLHGLVALGYQHLTVCHLDHGLRGEQANHDAEFVQSLASELRFTLEIGHVDARAFGRMKKLSLETAARMIRYQFFAEAAARRKCASLFLAHQADDQAETFLFRLFRGAGPAGLAAMAFESERQVGEQSLRILRPLLGVWRAEVDAFLQAQSLAWREDPTNADLGYGTRNRLRHEVLPLLARAMGRDVKGALWRAADILGAEEEWLTALTKTTGNLPTELPLSWLADKPVALQRRMIRTWLEQANVPGTGYREVELVRSLYCSVPGTAKVNMPGGRCVRRRRGVLFATAAAKRTNESKAPSH